MARTKQTPGSIGSVIGDSLADIGKNIFGGIHTAGKLLASAFGAGKAAESLESFETKQGWLPGWAAGGQPQAATQPNKVAKVTTPDYVVIAPKSGSAPVVVQDAAIVTVTGGGRFDGNGYKHGDKVGSTFSFGFDQPVSVSIVRRNSSKVDTSDVKQVLFLGGSEEKQTVVGFNWYSLLDPTGTWGTIESASSIYDAATHSGDPGTYMTDDSGSDAIKSRLRQQKQALTNPALLAHLKASQRRNAALRAQLHPKTVAASVMPTFAAPYFQPSVDVSASSFQTTPYDSSVYDGSTDNQVMGLERSNGMSVMDLEDQVIREVTSDVPGAGWDEIVGAYDVNTEGDYTVGVSTPYTVGLTVDHLPVALPPKQWPGAVVVGAAVSSTRGGAAPAGGTATGGKQPAAGSVAAAASAAAAHAAAAGNTKQLAQQKASISQMQQRAGFVTKTTPAGNKILSLQPNRNKKTQTASIKNARDIAVRSSKIADSILTKIKNPSKTPTKVRGIIGAAASTKRPGAAASLAKVQKLANDVKANAKKLNDQADKHEKAYTGFKAKVDAGVKVTRAKTDPSGRSAIHGDGYAIMRDAIAGDLYSSYPTTPISTGVDPTTGLPYSGVDPTTGLPYGSTGAIDPTTGLPMGGSLASQLPGPPDYGLPPPPTKAPPLQPGVDYLPDPLGPTPGITKGDETIYQTVPDDSCVVYDGSHGFPEKSVCSFTYYFGKLSTDTSTQLMCGTGSGFFMGNDGQWRYWCASAYNDGIAIDHRTMRPNADEATSMPALAQSSENHLWGPIIGNPKGALKGLRYAVTDDKWFWFRDTAPTWATQADDLVRQQQAITDYKTALLAAQTDYANAQAQDQINAQQAQQMAQQQAQEDAATQRQYQQELSQAQHDADVQATQQQAQQAQLDQQWQQQQMQQMTEQQQQRAQERQARLQMAQQQQQMDQQAQQAQIQFMQQNPQLYAQLVQTEPQELYQGMVQTAQDSSMDTGGDNVEDGIDWGDGNDSFERAASGRSSDYSAEDLEEDL